MFCWSTELADFTHIIQDYIIGMRNDCQVLMKLTWRIRVEKILPNLQKMKT